MTWIPRHVLSALDSTFDSESDCRCRAVRSLECERRTSTFVGVARARLARPSKFRRAELRTRILLFGHTSCPKWTQSHRSTHGDVLYCYPPMFRYVPCQLLQSLLVLSLRPSLMLSSSQENSKPRCVPQPPVYESMCWKRQPFWRAYSRPSR